MISLMAWMSLASTVPLPSASAAFSLKFGSLVPSLQKATTYTISTAFTRPSLLASPTMNPGNAGKRHQQKSVDGYNRLPDVFTKEDVMRCFGYDKPRSALKKIARLRDSKHIEAVDKTDQFKKVVQMIV